MTVNYQTEPRIYYIVQGRKKNNDDDYFEQCFVDINPIIARNRAFAFFEDFSKMMYEGKQIFFRNDENKLIKFHNFELKDTALYTVNFAENNVGIDGIALYMVVSNPINYIGLNDIKDQRYLIYSIQNFSNSKLKQVITSLKREYGYYRFLKIDTSTIEEEIKVLKPKISNKHLLINESATIISIPLNWFDLQNKINLRLENCAEIKEIVLNDNQEILEIIKDLDWNAINQNIASFLNSNGGRIILGFDKNATESVFKQSLFFHKNELLKEISKEFRGFESKIKVDFININSIRVAIIKVEKNIENPYFFKKEFQNIYFYRNSQGLQKTSDNKKIAKHLFYIFHKKVAIKKLINLL